MIHSSGRGRFQHLIRNNILKRERQKRAAEIGETGLQAPSFHTRSTVRTAHTKMLLLSSSHRQIMQAHEAIRARSIAMCYKVFALSFQFNIGRDRNGLEYTKNHRSSARRRNQQLCLRPEELRSRRPDQNAAGLVSAAFCFYTDVTHD